MKYQVIAKAQCAMRKCEYEVALDALSPAAAYSAVEDRVLSSMCGGCPLAADDNHVSASVTVSRVNQDVPPQPCPVCREITGGDNAYSGHGHHYTCDACDHSWHVKPSDGCCHCLDEGTERGCQYCGVRT